MMSIEELFMLIWSLPETKIAVLSVAMLLSFFIALVFIFRIIGKGKDLILMMFWTVVQVVIVLAATFVALLCTGMLLTDFMERGLDGMFPTIIELYHDYISTPFIYNWRSPLSKLQTSALDILSYCTKKFM